MIGLDEIPAESLPNDKFPQQTLKPEQRRIVTVKHELAMRGMLETVTWSFTDSKLAEMFRKGQEAVLLYNPIAADLDEMRPSTLPNLLLAVKNNIARGYANLALFEVGPEFNGRKPGQQQWVAGGVRTGMTSKKTGTVLPGLMICLTPKQMRLPRLRRLTALGTARRFRPMLRNIIIRDAAGQCGWVKT